MLITTPDTHELEVIPGHHIYANEVQGAPKGVFLTWDHLTDDQRDKFLEVHAELAQAVGKLQGMFSAEFQGRENTCRG